MFVKYLVGSPYLLCSPGWILIGFTTLTISQKTPPITHPGLMIFSQIPNTHIYTGLSENGLSSVSLYTCPFCGIPYFQTHSYASQTKSIINLKQSKRTWTCHKSNFLRKFTEKCRTPEWAPWSSTGLYTYCKNPSVWTHCLGKKQMNQRLTHKMLTPLAIHHLGNNLRSTPYPKNRSPRRSTEGILRLFTQAILRRHLHVFRCLWGMIYPGDSLPEVESGRSNTAPMMQI